MRDRSGSGKRGVFWLRAGQVPGSLADGETELVHGRDVVAVKRERAAALRRLGRRSAVQRTVDTQMRSFGVPVFDRDGGNAELESYLASRH